MDLPQGWGIVAQLPRRVGTMIDEWDEWRVCAARQNAEMKGPREISSVNHYSL